MERRRPILLKVNPTVPIPAETTAVHGITDDMIKDEPTFKERAHEVNNIIKDADLAGFNSNRFDIPLLAEEMLRAGIDFEMGNRNAIDVQNIFHKMEQRTLVAAYRFYCDKDLENAHSAEADVIATFEVLKAQVQRYEELENDMEFLAKFSTHNKFKIIDFAGRLAENDEGQPIYNFGKHKGKTLEELITEFKDQLLGKSVYQRFNAQFPILIKFIEAKDNLSVQLHPDDQLAKNVTTVSGKLKCGTS